MLSYLRYVVGGTALAALAQLIHFVTIYWRPALRSAVLAVVVFGAINLVGCRAPRPASPTELGPATICPDSVTLTACRPDSITVQEPGKPARRVAAAPVRIGKKATVNFFYSQATVTAAGKKAVVAVGDGTKVVAGKVKAPVAVADSQAVATDQRGTRQAALALGPNAQTGDQQLEDKTVAPLAALLRPVGIGLAVLLIIAAVVAYLKFG